MGEDQGVTIDVQPEPQPDSQRAEMERRWESSTRWFTAFVVSVLVGLLVAFFAPVAVPVVLAAVAFLGLATVSSVAATFFQQEIAPMLDTPPKGIPWVLWLLFLGLLALLFGLLWWRLAERRANRGK